MVQFDYFYIITLTTYNYSIVIAIKSSSTKPMEVNFMRLRVQQIGRQMAI